MKRNLTVLACTFIVICAFTILPPLSSDSGFPFLYGAKASSEDIIPPLPSIDEIHERFNMRNSIIFPLSEIKHGSGNYFGCNVVLNGVFSGSLSYQTYDNFSMQGFSLEIHYIHDSAAAEKKAWVTSQSQNNALDFTHELSKSIWFFTEVLRATWPDMSEEEAHEIILGSMQALVDQGFESLNFDYLKGLQKNGSLGPSGIYPTYKGYEFYFSSGVNWIGLKLRRPSLKPAIENNSVTIDQLASSYFLTLQSDVSSTLKSKPKLIEKEKMVEAILGNASESGIAMSFILTLTLSDPEDIFLVIVVDSTNSNSIYLCKDSLAFEWNVMEFPALEEYIKNSLQPLLDLKANPPYIPIDILLVVDDIALTITEDTLSAILTGLQ